MANTTRNKPGQEQITAVPEGTEVLENIQLKYEQNKKRINTIAGIVLAVVVGFFAYKKLYQEPRNEKASAAIYYAQKYFVSDSLDKALNGDGAHSGFLKVIKKYDGTDAANLSKYYAGAAYLKKGDNKNAIKYLEDFNGKGTLAEYTAFGALGDAYMNDGKLNKGIEYYEKAASKKDDMLHAPIYLFRAGLAYEMNNKPEEAKKMYKRVRDEYPQSPQAREMDKYLAQLGELE